VAIAAAFAAVLISVLSLRAAEVMIAFAPGSVDAMMLLALALNLDPVYVGAHHLTRIFFVSLTMPLVARRTARSLKIQSEPPKQLPKQPRKPPLKRPPFSGLMDGLFGRGRLQMSRQSEPFPYVYQRFRQGVAQDVIVIR
jgi:hypothetical protein